MTVPAPAERLSAGAARRIALAAQGFAEARPAGPAGTRQVARMLDRLGVLQIDSVNVLARAHYLPLQARLGAYPMALLDRLAYRPRRRLFEYWGHEASLLPIDTQPLFRWRMARAAAGGEGHQRRAAYRREHGAYIDRVADEVRRRGPLAASELSECGKATGPWWGWSDGKRALEWLFWAGIVTTRARRNFERVYDLTERVIPAEVLALPTPAPEEAQRRLLLRAARAMGIATERDLRDYFRLAGGETRARLAELVEEGALVPVAVEGWEQPAYLDPDARRPRRVAARALLSPFDSLIWERTRTERLFGFHYRIAFYTPAEKRTHGYYVMPFLLGDRLVARIDLKADRAGGRLLALAAHGEAGADPAAVAPALAAELHAMAGWLGLGDVRPGRRGDLMPGLRRALG